MSRRRSENFTTAHREFVIDFIRSNRIIESKDVTLKTLAKKQKAWSDLTATFNSKYNSAKSVNQMKVLWKGLKSKTKKNIALMKRETNATGGGVNLAPNLSITDGQISEIIAAEMEPLECSYDGDAVQTHSSTSKVDIDSDNDSEIENRTVSDAARKPTCKCNALMEESQKCTSNSAKRPTTLDFFTISRERLDVERRKAISQERIAEVSHDV